MVYANNNILKILQLKTIEKKQKGNIQHMTKNKCLTYLKDK